MKSLKRLPWTPILLLLLIVSNIFNYVQIEGIRKGLAGLYLRSFEMDSIYQVLQHIDMTTGQSSEQLREIDYTLDCTRNPIQTGCQPTLEEVRRTMRNH
jgi:hypothetical protein